MRSYKGRVALRFADAKSEFLNYLIAVAETNDIVRSAHELVRLCEGNAAGVRFEICGKARARLKEVEYLTTVIQDKDDGWFCISTPISDPLVGKIGDTMLFSGSTVANGPYPTFARTTSVRIVKEGTPAAAIPVSLEEAVKPKYDYHYLKLEGLILDAFRDEVDDASYFLILSDGSRTISIPIYSQTDIENRIKRLVGARVAVRCISLPRTAGVRLKHGRLFYAESPDAIETLVPPPSDPFAMKARRRLTGTVVAVWQRKCLLLRTASGEICRADLAEANAPSYGDSVEIAGFPATDLYHDNLTRAIWRPTSPTPRLPNECPVATTVDHILSAGVDNSNGINPTFHGRAIRLTGTVRGRPSSDGHLMLACGDHLVPVDATALNQAFSDVLDGSRVSISGTCVMEIPNWHADEPFPHIEGITLVPRTADDIVILARPPWWTVARLFAAIGILLLAMLFILIWNVMLRKRAELRGRELLREQLEHVKADLKIEERSRLSVELHDSLAQNLASVSMEIEAANLLKAEDPNAMSEHLLAAARTLQSCRDELRNCLWDLRSQALEETDMNTAIRRTLLPHVKNTHVAVRFNIPRSELPDNIAHAILQVIRELTVNAIRHGKATSIRIAGDLTDKILMFSVSDNGRGFDPTNRPGVAQGHFGLQGIRERIQKLNGTVRIDSQIGHGTRAVVILAVAEPKGEAPQNSET